MRRLTTRTTAREGGTLRYTAQVQFPDAIHAMGLHPEGDRIVVVTLEQTMPYTFDTEFAVKGLIYDALLNP